MSVLDKYMKSLSFLTSDLSPESTLLQNLNKKYYTAVKLKKKPLFIQIENMDIELIQRNEINYFPYNIKFKSRLGFKITIPVFLETPSLLLTLLKSNKFKFKPIEITDPSIDLTKNELEYYYHEKIFLEVVLKRIKLKL